MGQHGVGNLSARTCRERMTLRWFHTLRSTRPGPSIQESTMRASQPHVDVDLRACTASKPQRSLGTGRRLHDRLSACEWPAGMDPHLGSLVTRGQTARLARPWASREPSPTASWTTPMWRASATCARRNRQTTDTGRPSLQPLEWRNSGLCRPVTAGSTGKPLEMRPHRTEEG